METLLKKNPNKTCGYHMAIYEKYISIQAHPDSLFAKELREGGGVIYHKTGSPRHFALWSHDKIARDSGDPERFAKLSKGVVKDNGVMEWRISRDSEETGSKLIYLFSLMLSDHMATQSSEGCWKVPIPTLD